ncbi:RNA polymerase subunit sigma-70 [Paramagnetospirillum kuznetsovii]|uniref:RNA polymerase subunit sigma-70 n=1 Tax=Paramagnetospirillum kuznetsovii TaxID=2053833 RepID=A0A364NTX2_9PROT|nr:RNA polymerase sigma factor [Paramagnetospirillum kuznetsovii]RAU20317.1 RNA polymerase subunit sigma-70 [Paramagnetospirillum kuznetsovii]
MRSNVAPRHPDLDARDADSSDTETSPERLYARSRAILRPALAGRLGSFADAEDVLHEAFIRFLNAYADRTIANPLALLARIAMNIIRDSARSEGFRRRQMGGQTAPICAGPPPHSPETLCSDRQGLQQVQDAINRLPPRCREVFLLHRLDGMPHAEVARTLGISRSMVEKHMARAETQLRAELAHHIDSPAVADA